MSASQRIRCCFVPLTVCCTAASIRWVVDVGARTTMYLLNGVLSSAMQNGSLSFKAEEWETARFGNQTQIIGNGVVILWIEATNKWSPAYTRTADKPRRLYKSTVEMYRAASSWLARLGVTKPSKGMYAVLLALAMCRQVDVYDFRDELPWQPFHCMRLEAQTRRKA